MLEYSSRYQPDIDVVGAVSVIFVPLFHLKVSGLEAGYIGSDVFFVISRHLIVRYIIESQP
jgi:peptidoglycan/LPS O-acetylase OafA/YrhL